MLLILTFFKAKDHHVLTLTFFCFYLLTVDSSPSSLYSSFPSLTVEPKNISSQIWHHLFSFITLDCYYLISHQDLTNILTLFCYFHSSFRFSLNELMLNWFNHWKYSSWRSQRSKPSNLFTLFSFYLLFFSLLSSEFYLAFPLQEFNDDNKGKEK